MYYWQILRRFGVAWVRAASPRFLWCCLFSIQRRPKVSTPRHTLCQFPTIVLTDCSQNKIRRWGRILRSNNFLMKRKKGKRRRKRTERLVKLGTAIRLLLIHHPDHRRDESRASHFDMWRLYFSCKRRRTGSPGIFFDNLHCGSDHDQSISSHLWAQLDHLHALLPSILRLVCDRMRGSTTSCSSLLSLKSFIPQSYDYTRPISWTPFSPNPTWCLKFLATLRHQTKDHTRQPRKWGRFPLLWRICPNDHLSRKTIIVVKRVKADPVVMILVGQTQIHGDRSDES